MKTGLKLITIFMSTCFIIFLTGCGIGAIVGGTPTGFQGSYEIKIVKPHADMLNVIAEVGKSMGYRVSALNVKGNSISISSESSMAGMMIIGTMNDITIMATIMDSGKKIDVQTMLVGNFSVGTKEESDKIFGDFKTRLLAALK